jgi:hypothetical protein
MTITAGALSDLYVGASPNKVLGLNQVKLSVHGKEIDVTSFDSTKETYIGTGIIGADVTAAGFYDNADTTGQIAIRGAIGTTIACEVRWGDTTPKCAGTLLVLGFDMDAAVQGGVPISITGKLTGAFTFS